MRFALLGLHPDGVALADAIAHSGRHQIIAYTDAPSAPSPSSWQSTAVRVSDVEAILTDERVEAVIVAGTLPVRPEQLRRALQSKRHVLCVHPAGPTPEIAYEAALLREDVHRVAMPLYRDYLQPALARLRSFVQRGKAAATASIGAFQLLEIRLTGRDVLGLDEIDDGKPSFPGWDMVRRVGGEIAEVSGYAEQEIPALGDVILLAGKFQQGGLFQLTLIPSRNSDRAHFRAVGERGEVEVLWPDGLTGPAFLSTLTEHGESVEEAWPSNDPWPGIVVAFEQALAEQPSPGLTWNDEVVALELDDSARRAIEKRRAMLLDYQEATEQVGFKGTMTLLGCGVLWLIVLLFILGTWLPWLRWLTVPLLVGFMGLQLLRLALPKDTKTG